MTKLVPGLSVAFQTDKPLAAYAELAAAAEGHGFGAVSVYGDLMFQPPLPALLAMAAATRFVRLGPACLNPFTSHPVEIAGQIASLDRASGGRAYIGLARGAWLESIGIEPVQPLRAMREAVAVIHALLRGGGEEVSGETFRLSAAHRLQYPVLRGEIPLLIGAWGPGMASMAGEVAEELKVGGSANPRMVEVVRAALERGTRRVGRPPGSVRVVLGAVTVVDDDREAARALARAEVARYLSVVVPFDPTISVEPDLLARIDGLVQRGESTQAAGLVTDDLLDLFTFAGSPRDIIVRAEAIFAAGASRIEFGTPHGLTAANGLKLLGQRVLPALRGAAAS